MNIVHPFMPNLKDKSLDDLIKEMNNINSKMRMIRDGAMLNQIKMVLTGYQEEYQRRMAEEMERKPKDKKKGRADE